MRNLNENQSNQALDLFKDLLKRAGLPQDAQIVQQSTFDPTLNLAVLFKFPLDMNDVRTNMPFIQPLKDLQESIYNSQIVREEVKLVEDKLKMANAACDELMLRIAELEKYKTHYELEMKLRHGESK